MKGIPFKDVLVSIDGTVYQEPTIVKCDGIFTPASDDTYYVQGDPAEVVITGWNQIHTHGSGTIIDFDEFFESFYNEFVEKIEAIVMKSIYDKMPDADWSEGLEKEDFT